MTAKILDGKAVAKQIRDELRAASPRIRERLGRPPALSIVLVGDDPASQVYVRNKLKTAEEAGMGIAHERLGRTDDAGRPLEVVRRFNEDRSVDGILVQSPLPKAMGADAEQQVFDAIDPAKDVDGFSPISAGRLVQNREGFAPCTPAGVIELLVRSEDPDRRQARRRDRPVRHRRQADGFAAAAQERHRDDLPLAHARPAGDGARRRHPRRSDRPPRVRDARTSSNPARSSIDVGINSVTSPEDASRIFAAHPDRLEMFERRGSVLVGDVHPDVAETAGALTPVPGGVGPLTIAMLMANTVKAAEIRAR